MGLTAQHESSEVAHVDTTTEVSKDALKIEFQRCGSAPHLPHTAKAPPSALHCKGTPRLPHTAKALPSASHFKACLSSAMSAGS